MLTQLCIRNFAIVDDMSIDFKSGMSAITGETGAGKSIALDALSLCLGARAEASMVRDASKKAEISASFHTETLPDVQKWLESRELEADEECVIRRTISAEGRSKAYVNAAPVPVALLKELGSLLVSLHGQHDHHLLMKSEQQLTLLDQYGDHSSLLAKVKESWKAWQSLLKEKKQLSTESEATLAQRQLLEYQVRELEEFDIQEGEFEQLEQDHNRLANTTQLQEHALYGLNSLYDGEHNNAYGLVEQVIQRLQESVELDDKLAPIVELLEQSSVQIEEAVRELRHYQDHLESDPQAFAEVESRLTNAMQLARKHQVAPEELVNHYHALQGELAGLANSSERLETIDKDIEAAEAEFKAHAEKLSSARKTTGKKLSSQVQSTMRDLNMKEGQFLVRIESSLQQSSAKGFDSVSFDVAMNAGQTLQPLQKVASGGELSRISLAIQVLTAQHDGLPTLIFDEVDVGVSGPTAATVGKLLRKLGQANQVICVTHLPQVAARAHQQLEVEKVNQNGKTTTQMTPLNDDQRVKALARLLGGDNITANSIANAQELLAG
ncbi:MULTISPECIES: DNA repair protein RecN [Gammaproteobacteria]|uniref:DNA repair protein RecN n=1 Tax=Gammaproteobacteria TaxID=1236 RepID=UPI000DD051FE|nr:MULTISPECIES: DNA repair protein RecN [Gammaproteobacteria]RTE86903.1 DNA repair protein RecN [Aliidiomarina sp. B3213]TCZ93307.1 DNA repair protein RecN [Lysobacter sp. N42]